MDAHGYESKIQDLLEKIDILERKLKQTSDNKQKFLLKLKSTEEENEMLKDQLSRQATQNKQLNSELATQANKIAELQTMTKHQSEKYKTKFEILNKELEDKESNIDKLVSQIKAKDDTVKFLTVNNEMTMKSHSQIKEETASLLKINSELEQEIRRLNSKIDAMTINSRSESGLLLEIEHLKDDNVRLLKMLKSTEEFKDFAYLAENVTGGIHYIKGSTKTPMRRTNKENEMRTKTKLDSFNNANWVPSETVQYMNKFKSLYNLSDEVINEILLGLNKIWSEREAKLVSRLKQSYQGEIMALRRKAVYKSPYDEVQSGKTISKLKKDLKKTKDDLKETKSIAKKLKTNPSGIDLIDNAMKVAANFQRTKHLLENEISNLKGKIKGDKNLTPIDSGWVGKEFFYFS